MVKWSLGALCISLAGPCVYAQAIEPLYTEMKPARAARHAAVAPGTPDLARLARRAVPAVVGVLTTQAPEAGSAASADPLKDLFERYYGDGPRRGLGTGFIINSAGYIITNAHVVDGANDIEVDVGEGDDAERLPGRVVGKDEQSDVALLKIEAKHPLPVVPLGDSDKVSIAEWVMVIGNPFGLSHSVTIGIVSHKGRDDIAPAGKDGYYDFIQTDASINPGNSGGPILNMRGEVIGIATAINASGQGIGFAIPINMAKEIVGQLKQHGRVVRSWMGVSVRDLPREPAARVEHGARGVLVTDVIDDGPADHAGLRVGDVIVAFEGRSVPNPAQLRWYVATAGVGRSVTLKVRRGGGRERSVRVKLTDPPGEPPRGEPAVAPSPAAASAPKVQAGGGRAGDPGAGPRAGSGGAP